jgi:hypothetical protein
MSLINIKAQISCDECGNVFSVFLDPAENVSCTLFDLVENIVRGGCGTNDPLRDSTSVQDERMLCVTCTKEADKETGEE